MENRLKPETCEVISRLKDAYIRTIMCTGDNILTALSVAHDSDLIDDDDCVIRVQVSKETGEIMFSYGEKFLLKSNVKIFHSLIKNFFNFSKN
jgi:magnesium-transporting ATPase (P-type)